MMDTPVMETLVLIVGAGPTGLTLACELARRDISFCMVDAAAGPQTGSRGKGIQPRTLEIFEDLGIADDVLAHGQLAMTIRVTVTGGQVILGGAEPEMLKDRPDMPYTTSLITPEWRVEEALRSRLAELGGRLEFGATLAGVEQTDDGVTATVAQNGKTTTIRASWLVGCDGAHSVVRKQARIAFLGETRDSVRMIVADLEVDNLDRNAWHMWRHAEGLVSLCPLPSTNVFQYQAGISPGQDPDLGVANMQAILDRRSGQTDIRLRQPEWKSLWHANVRLAQHYRDGRVLLAGDAAHIHSPAGGQGMNTGIQDAYNLGWKLAAVIQGAAPGLLDTYEGERRPVAARVLALSDERLKQTLEQNAMPVNRGADTTQLGINYRTSTLAHDDRDDTAELRAGDRAPDATHLATVDGERRLFDLVHSGKFTLLSFAKELDRQVFPTDVDVLHVVDRPTRPNEITDTHGHLVHAYNATTRTLVLIRPDGYVAAISDGGSTAVIHDYLAAIGPGVGHED